MFLSGFVTVEFDNTGRRVVIGDMKICGRDLEIGNNIIGPSKSYMTLVIPV